MSTNTTVYTDNEIINILTQRNHLAWSLVGELEMALEIMAMARTVQERRKLAAKMKAKVSAALEKRAIG